MEEKNPGALIDTRPPEEQAKDFKFEELVASAAPVNWVEKPASEWRSFPIFDQDGSGSCVAQTLKKMLGVYVWLKTGFFVKLSASHIYQRRANRPADGMGADDAFKIVQQGTTLEDFAPSEKMNDAGMDAIKVLPFMEEIGKVFKIGKPIVGPTKDIEAIASIIQQTGKAVMVWFYFSNGLTPREWVDVPVIKYPNLLLTGPNTARHSVAAVDFTLYKGKKALIIEDSWGLDKATNGKRVITEDFFKKRNWYAAHFMNFAFEGTVSKPHYRFTKDLEFSPTPSFDPDVVALQDILKYETLFPSNVESTGYFGSITRDAVGKFQEKYGLTSPGGGGYGRVGPLTRAKLNELYD